MTHEEIKRNLLEADIILKMLEDIKKIHLQLLIDSIHRYTHINEYGKHINYKDASYEDVMYYMLLVRRLKTINEKISFMECDINMAMPALSEISEFVSDVNANSFYEKIKNDDDSAPSLSDA